jgi:hypothetical protein
LLRNGNKLMSIQRKDKKNQTELAARKFKQVSDRMFGSHIEHNNHYCIIYKEFRDNDLDVQQQKSTTMTAVTRQLLQGLGTAETTLLIMTTFTLTIKNKENNSQM